MKLVLMYAAIGALCMLAAYLSGRGSGTFFLYVVGGLGFLLAAAGQYFKTTQGKG
jgi:hypothetical protein